MNSLRSRSRPALSSKRRRLAPEPLPVLLRTSTGTRALLGGQALPAGVCPPLAILSISLAILGGGGRRGESGLRRGAAEATAEEEDGGGGGTIFSPR